MNKTFTNEDGEIFQGTLVKIENGAEVWRLTLIELPTQEGQAKA